MAASIDKILKSIRKNHFLKFGLPMLILIVGGSFGLKEFRQLRYEIIDRRQAVDPEALDRLKIKEKQRKLSLEEEFQKIEEDDIDCWYNIRGPRPWEDSKEFQDAQRKNMAIRAQSKTN
ncbi:cytochrome c oxidase assembly protein COX16 homolog, mitochondrial-like [Anneissia japonica]|uniref:cytochrome c oxidase assembly protein COX16 homolog, mitochondrial-like n=1 Tax=Anneissia japonica TaxID=1529436 RepID=UPI001425B10E|nr:cytochrome c oxidase assembly protein COX16 homolog, mitochondrial-like [Anneissia japonica]